MTVKALEALEALKQEQAALPDQIRQGVQGLKRAEVRRLQARETELNDLLIDAELALLDARIAALPEPAQELTIETAPADLKRYLLRSLVPAELPNVQALAQDYGYQVQFKDVGLGQWRVDLGDAPKRRKK